MQFLWILFSAGLLTVEIRPRAVKLLMKEWAGEIPDSDANITLSEGEAQVDGEIRSGGRADASILTNQMKIFENGAKIYSIKKVLHSGYRIVIDMVVVIDESIVFVISVRL